MDYAEFLSVIRERLELRWREAGITQNFFP
jgi:hypothetical protein